MQPVTPDTGIVVYSRTGHSARLAEALGARLCCTPIHLAAPAYAGIFGALRAGFDSLRQHCVLPPQDFGSLARLRQLVVCGPVWTSYPCTPVRALLRQADRLPKHVALFLTSTAHSPAEKAITVAETDLGRPFTAAAVLANEDEGTAEETRALNIFCETLTAA